MPEATQEELDIAFGKANAAVNILLEDFGDPYIVIGYLESYIGRYPFIADTLLQKAREHKENNHA